MLLTAGALGERFPPDTTNAIVGGATILAVLFYLIASLTSDVRRIHDMTRAAGCSLPRNDHARLPLPSCHQQAILMA